MGLRITDRHTSQKRRQLVHERLAALQKEALRWAERRVGDQNALSAHFIEKVEDIRKLDTLSGCVTKKALDLSVEIRTQAIPHLHDEKAFDLARILNLI